jgi:hypothetical protein
MIFSFWSDPRIFYISVLKSITMKTILSISLSFLFILGISAQNHVLTTDIWYFGAFAGVDFSAGYPVAISNSSMNTFEGCASITRSNGELLFYTNGESIWDASHSIMVNGSGLIGNGLSGSTESCAIVPDPGDSNHFYVFTIDEGAGVLAFSEVDMSATGNGTLTSPLGEVIGASKNTILNTSVGEKIEVVHSPSSNVIWVFAHESDNASFLRYKVDLSGLNTVPFVQNIGSNHSSLNMYFGHMKASLNSGKLAIVNRNISSIEVFDLDPVTGILSNPIALPIQLGYGLAFSSSGQYLYANGRYELWRYDFQTLSWATVPIDKPSVLSGNRVLRSMTQGPDNEVYVVVRDYPFLSRIINSNSTAAFLAVDYIPLSGTTRMGLPDNNNFDFCTEVQDISINSCDAFVAPNGSIWTSSGSYADTIYSLNGCDSIFNYDITVDSSNYIDFSDTACDSYTWLGNTYVQSGIYSQTFINSRGCDSTLSLDLTIIDLDTSVIVNFDTLISVQSGVVYSWLDCDSQQIVVGENNQTFVPNKSGNYAVVISQNGCSDTSSCHNVLKVSLRTPSTYSGLISVYPNPASGPFNIFIKYGSTNARLRIYSIAGRLLSNDILIKEGINRIDQNLFEGIYLFEFRFENGIIHREIFVQS